MRESGAPRAVSSPALRFFAVVAAALAFASLPPPALAATPFISRARTFANNSGISPYSLAPKSVVISKGIQRTWQVNVGTCPGPCFDTPVWSSPAITSEGTAIVAG
jgi:hypothetical protein